MNHLLFFAFGPGISARKEKNVFGTLEAETEVSRILDTYGTGLLRFAYSYIHNLADAQEILQDVLLRYLQKKPDFSSEEACRAWLFQVTANLSKNRLRFNRLRQTASLDLLAERALVQSPDLSFIWHAVQSLPEKYRSVIHLYYMEGYTTVQIASILQQKETTVRSRLARARARLKELLQEEYDFD